ncbi:hypothetical protein LCGC14_1528670 [marine sediment metagenome]|uniref:Uncharacterized protein n=1 Tax=marine sediment metagenome TaxID=412755 RepID=A0A0F9IWT6_9ZZZZ
MTATTPCPTCLGSGIDSKRAATPLAMPGFVDYVAAMYPCPECKGTGRDRANAMTR